MTTASGRLIAAREADTTEDEVFPADRHDGRRHVREAEVGDRPQVCDLGISTVSDARADHPTTIIAGEVVGQYLRHRIPVAGREIRLVALAHLACRVFQPWRRAEFVEPRERGVEVCLVEELAAADQVAVDRRDVDLSPLGLEALLRGPLATWVTTAPSLLTRCTASM